MGSAFIAISSQWFWLQVFGRSFPVSETVSALAIAASLVVLLSVLGLLVWARGVFVLRAVILLSLIFVLYRIVGPYFGVGAISAPTKGFLMAVALVAAAGAARKWAAMRWDRLYLATVAFGLIFFASFPVVGLFLRMEGGAVLGFDSLRGQPEAPRNFVVLLLDELSPEVAGPIADALRKKSMNVQVATISAAGKNTMNAVPAMFTGERFDRTMPCGPALLCSEGKALDYSRLRAVDGAVDIVSFLALYCSIQGLRSCVAIRFEPGLSALHLLACNTLTPFLSALGTTCPEPTEKGSATRIATGRKEMERALLSAPFWNEGGLLYAHLLLPHPPSDSPNGSLLAEYQANVLASARLVRLVLEKLEARFGDEFVFVVVSDHPLRVDAHCAAVRYRGAECKNGLPENKNRVPLIVASPKRLNPPTIDTGIGILRSTACRSPRVTGC